MNEVDRLFIVAVEMLRLLDERYWIAALDAAYHWDDERLSRGISGEFVPDNVRPPRPALALVKGD